MKVPLDVTLIDVQSQYNLPIQTRTTLFFFLLSNLIMLIFDSALSGCSGSPLPQSARDFPTENWGSIRNWGLISLLLLESH